MELLLSVFDPAPLASRAVKLARRGFPLPVEGDAVGDLEREALVEGLPVWFKERSGWLYQAANASWPGLYKIGCTRKNVAERLASLGGAGMATPWVEVASWKVHDAHWLEAKVHACCRKWLYKGELFHADAVELQGVIETCIAEDQRLLKAQLSSFLLPGELDALLGLAESPPVFPKGSYTSIGQ